MISSCNYILFLLQIRSRLDVITFSKTTLLYLSSVCPSFIFADYTAIRKQMRIICGSLSVRKVRSCFRCNLKLSGLRDQRRINRPSENRLGIPCVRDGNEKKKRKKRKGIQNERQVVRRKRTAEEEVEEQARKREREKEKDSEHRRSKVKGRQRQRERKQTERWDEKLDLQICLDYYEIARLPVSGAQSPSVTS